VLAALVILLVVMVPGVALAQASPFSTGTTAFSTDLLAIVTPLAVIATIILGVLALFHVVNWSWCIGAFGGIVLIFGAPQIVAWTRGLFGV
jgi:type IV secretion system protein VirB2